MVQSLRKFVVNNSGTMSEYKLSNCHLVVDANNFKIEAFNRSQGYRTHLERNRGQQGTDLFGGDLVQFARYVSKILDNFRACKIEPIFVYDGAKDEKLLSTDKTQIQSKRAKDKLSVIKKVDKLGKGSFVSPGQIPETFNAIVAQKGFQIVCAMFEADLVVARLANQYQCPVLSEDSDFMLMDLDYGQILIEYLDCDRIHDGREGSKYMLCKRYTVKNLCRCFPGLNVNCLPIIAILVGNDFVEKEEFEEFCISLRVDLTKYNRYGQRCAKLGPRILKILTVIDFLRYKTLEQATDLISQGPNRNRIKEFIELNYKTYVIPSEDDFYKEMQKLCDPKTLEDIEKVKILSDYLQNCIGKSMLTTRILEIAQRNTIVLKPTVGETNLASPRDCYKRVLRVLTQLTKTNSTDSRLTICDRVDTCRSSYVDITIEPLKHLEKFGHIDYTLMDVPSLDLETRRGIVLATFDCSEDEFEDGVESLLKWLKPEEAQEFFVAKLLLDTIDRLTKSQRVWKEVKQAVLLTILYYRSQDRVIPGLADFVEPFSKVVDSREYQRIPKLSQDRPYDIELVHQIAQIHDAVNSFTILNSFLAEPVVRIKCYKWLNSCLIYNLADELKTKKLTLPPTPELIQIH